MYFLIGTNINKMFDRDFQINHLTSDSLKKSLGGRNLYLIGMMGSGKTVTGSPLAKQLGYGFVDCDEVIEKVAKKSINSIFAEDGEEIFREIETKVIKEIGQLYGLVVATGGGIVTRSENWGILHQGIVICLDPGKERLLARISSDVRKRPLMQVENPEEVLDRLNNQRKSLYKEADLYIPVGDESPEKIALLIIEKLPFIINNVETQDAPQTIE